MDQALRHFIVVADDSGDFLIARQFLPNRLENLRLRLCCVRVDIFRIEICTHLFVGFDEAFHAVLPLQVIDFRDQRQMLMALLEQMFRSEIARFRVIDANERDRQFLIVGIDHDDRYAAFLEG